MRSILNNFIAIIHMLLDCLLDGILVRCLGPKQLCPPIAAGSIITKSATELALLIREKELKSADVVRAYIDRINEVNPVLNAVIDGPFLEALEEAHAIDERIEKGKISEDEFSKKPYLGVPFTTKDSNAVKGKLITLGLISRRTTRAEDDAECVRLMKEAGAIIIATTSVPEVNRWMETRNMLIGGTNNPYDSRRSVGGSSGGEGALIASCGSAFGIATDIGGSIRIPAFKCGIFGHKATTGTINLRGCTMRTGNETTMCAAGPMCRNAIDLMPILKILVGPKNSIALKLDEKVDVKKLKYYYIPHNNIPIATPVSSEMKATMEKTISYLSSITGEPVQLIELPGIEKCGNLWIYWMSQESGKFGERLGNGIKPNVFVELVKKLFNKSEFTLAAIYGLIFDLLPTANADKMRELTRKLDEALNSVLGDDGVLIYHSLPRTVPFHYHAFVKLHDYHYTSIFNIFKVPATQVPLGLSTEGLPLGIQVVAKRNNDRLCLAVAEELENAFGGWVPPFTTKS